MKKLLLHVLALALVLSLTSCSGGSEPVPSSAQSSKSTASASEQSKPTAPESKAVSAPELLSSGYVDIMKDGKFYMRYIATVTTDAGDFESEIATATDGKSTATIMDMMGTKIRTLILDGRFYQIDDASKTYMKMDIPEMEMDSELTEAEDLVYLGKGTDVINGKELPYEEYRTDDGTMRFFMDNKSLYALVIKTADGDMTMIIQELNDKIPAGMLELPTDYTQSAMPSIPAGIEMDEETKQELQELQEEFENINPEEMQQQVEAALREAGIDPENLPK